VRTIRARTQRARRQFRGALVLVLAAGLATAGCQAATAPTLAPAPSMGALASLLAATPAPADSAEASPETPTPEPTIASTPETTTAPTPELTTAPTPEPTAQPTPEPTATATPTPKPTAPPTAKPTEVPPRPGSLKLVKVSESDTEVVIKLSWSEPTGAAAKFKVFGLLRCVREAAANDGKPCIVPHTALRSGDLRLLATFDGKARSGTLRIPLSGEVTTNVLWERSDYYGLLLGATNSVGQSVLAIAASSIVCWGCTW
jgi:hypothetical protein